MVPFFKGLRAHTKEGPCNYNKNTGLSHVKDWRVRGSEGLEFRGLGGLGPVTRSL